MTVTLTDDALALALRECEDLTTSAGHRMFVKTGSTGIDRAREALFAADRPTVLIPNDQHRSSARNRARGRCEVCSNRRNQACRAVPQAFQPIAWIPENPLQVEHSIPRNAYHAIGIRNDVIESVPNLGYCHKTFNGLKGTMAFSPAQIVGLWQRHDYGADDEHAPAVVLGSSVMTSMTVSALRLPVLDDLIVPIEELRALGAIAREKKLPEVAAELEHVTRILARDWRNGLMVDATLLNIERNLTETRTAQERRRRVLRAASKRMPA